MLYQKRENKRNTPGKWPIEAIRTGMEKYKEIYSHYPHTLDFDKVDFLPSSKLIQRNFGGIVKLKELLGLDCDKDGTKGEYRSNIARRTWNDAVGYEQQFYEFLISKKPEISVHEHKILRPGNICCDFFVYTSDREGFAIDIFYAQDLFSLSRIVYLKNKRYNKLNFPVYFVLVGNDLIKQNDIDMLINNRKNPIGSNIKVLTECSFKILMN